jgi:isopenicillin-N N-acyltransferase-like protein
MNQLPVEVTGADAPSRGRELASLVGSQLPDELAIYRRLFAASGIVRLRLAAETAEQRLMRWAPDLADEITAIADASGIPPWQLFLLNARTEVLATAPKATGRGECSAIARPGLGGQTWDWHAELAPYWRVVRYSGTAIPFVTLTEAGILAKIGVNAAGVGLLFNILGHRADLGIDGVPVHAVARRILDSARTVAEAEAVVRGVRLAASSCFTLLDAERVSCLEASSAGVVEVPAHNGWAIHTNHFVSAWLADGDLRTGPETDTLVRHALLTARLTEADPRSPDELRQLLCAHEQDGAPVCCHAPADGALGDRWQTLATVVIEPAERRLGVLAGGPCESGRFLPINAHSG